MCPPFSKILYILHLLALDSNFRATVFQNINLVETPTSKLNFTTNMFAVKLFFRRRSVCLLQVEKSSLLLPETNRSLGTGLRVLEIDTYSTS